jgi:hypothetical protein
MLKYNAIGRMGNDSIYEVHITITGLSSCGDLPTAETSRITPEFAVSELLLL